MSSPWTDPIVVATAILVIVLPLLIIGAGELDERLRQRDSPLRGAVSVLRTWTLPLLAVWVVARVLFGFEPGTFGVRVVSTLLLVSLVAVALTLIKVLIERVRARPAGDRRGVPRLVLALPRLLLLLVAGWVLLDAVWGVDLTVALTALGVGSLVISFALQSTLSGLASGFLLLADRPFRPGDWIKVAGGEDGTGAIEGRVADMNWRSSRIEDRNGDLIIVPNAQLAGATIVNFDEPNQVHRIVVSLQVAFRNPPTLAKAMLLDAARATPGVLADPPPEARVVQIDDPLMGYEVFLWIDDYTAEPKIRADFGALVWYQSHRHGVPLPSPAQDLYLYDGEKTAQAARPDQSEIRRRLVVSPVLAELADADLDRLAASGTVARYAAGETILAAGSLRVGAGGTAGSLRVGAGGTAGSLRVGAGGTAGTVERGLYLLDNGQARIVVDAPDGSPLAVTDVAAGELFSQLGQERPVLASARLVAVTDCEVVGIAEAAATAVAGSYPQLAEALEHLSQARQRRIERALAARTPVAANDG